MRGQLSLITPAANLPVTLQEAKAHLRVDFAEDDAAIAALIAAATDLLDGPRGFLGRSLEPSTWDFALDAFPRAALQLPHGPVASVTSIVYADPTGAELVVPAEAYALDNVSDFGCWIIPIDPWPATLTRANAVRVRFVAGRGTPAGVKSAILDMVARRYDGRDGTRMLSPGLAAELAPYRRAPVQ